MNTDSHGQLDIENIQRILIARSLLRKLFCVIVILKAAKELKELETALSLLVNLTKVNDRACIQIVPRRREWNYVHVMNAAGSVGYLYNNRAINQSSSMAPL